MFKKDKSRKKELKGKKTGEKRSSSWRENIEMILEVLVYVFFINAFLLQTFVIPTPSMEDNMLIGDHLFVDKVAYSHSLGKLDGILLPQRKIERGMTVVIKSPPEIKVQNWERLLYVKRVIGLPGETLQIINHKVHINGNPIEEPYVFIRGDIRVPANFPPQNPSYWWDDFPPEFRYSLAETEYGLAFKIPDGHYFCMGDNRNLSADSRIWGPVPGDYIIGKPWRNYWSYDAPTDHYLNKGILERVFNVIIHFFSRTRWERTLKKY
jgi:signal peptidase I